MCGRTDLKRVFGTLDPSSGDYFPDSDPVPLSLSERLQGSAGTRLLRRFFSPRTSLKTPREIPFKEVDPPYPPRGDPCPSGDTVDTTIGDGLTQGPTSPSFPPGPRSYTTDRTENMGRSLKSTRLSHLRTPVRPPPRHGPGVSDTWTQ